MILDPVAFLIVFGDHGERRAVVLERPAAENLAVRLHGVITPLVPQDASEHPKELEPWAP